MMPEAAALALLASLLAAPAVSMSAADQKVAALDSRIHSASAADERAIGDFLRYALAEEAAMAKIEKAIRAADGPVPRPDFQKRLDAAQMPYRNRRDEMMQFAINKALTAYGMFAPMPRVPPSCPRARSWTLGSTNTASEERRHGRSSSVSLPRRFGGLPKASLPGAVASRS